jgi:hypothetical protein
MLRNLRRIAKFFVGFLGVLSALLAARYPLLPERLIATYREDANDATMLAAALTLIGFAAITAVVGTPRIKPLQIAQHKFDPKKILLSTSGVLLTLSALGLVSGYVLVHMSARIGNAVLAAEARASVDRLAQDFVVDARDPSTSTWHHYYLATQYIELEHVVERSSQEVLNSLGHGPLQVALTAVYILTISSLKLGLFSLASALYLRNQTLDKVKSRRQSGCAKWALKRRL